MRVSRGLRIFLLGSLLYLTLCSAGGVFLAEAALHPAPRPLTDEQRSSIQQAARSLNADLEDVSIVVSDGIRLRGWILHPRAGNGDAVILLHGVADNRAGVNGYGQILLAHGFTVLLPDARAHGASEGQIATYGLLERNDIREWFRYLNDHGRPGCIFGFGESMGAAQLLQSLGTGVHFCGVAAESPFANFREIAYDRMGQPFHLGAWFGRTVFRPMVEFAFLRARSKYGLDMDEISPERAASATKVPILLVHGQVDRNIPVRHSRRIHEKAPQTQLWEVPGADHCGAISVAPKEFEQRLVAWFSVPASR